MKSSRKWASPLRARLEALWLLRRGVLVIDTETTDLDGQICEICVVDARGRVLLDTLVRPSCPVAAGATAVHGLRDEDLEDAPTWAQVWGTLRWLTAGRTVAAYNAPFDRNAIVRSCAAAGVEVGDLQRASSWWCIMRARSVIEGQRWRALDAGHRARGDALAALDVMRSLPLLGSALAGTSHG